MGKRIFDGGIYAGWHFGDYRQAAGGSSGRFYNSGGQSGDHACGAASPIREQAPAHRLRNEKGSVDGHSAPGILRDVCIPLFASVRTAADQCRGSGGAAGHCAGHNSAAGPAGAEGAAVSWGGPGDTVHCSRFGSDPGWGRQLFVEPRCREHAGIMRGGQRVAF
ncbi:hypothetical protein D3C75_848500 [compost metagenome]